MDDFGEFVDWQIFSTFAVELLPNALMFVPQWLYLGILLLLAIVVPLVIIRVLRRVFASKHRKAGTGRPGCLVTGGFMLLFLAMGLSLAFYFPKTEIRTIEADGAVRSRTVILYSPVGFIEENKLGGFSFDSTYVANNANATLALRPRPGCLCDTIFILAGAVIPVAKTSVSDYNFEFASQLQ